MSIVCKPSVNCPCLYCTVEFGDCSNGFVQSQHHVNIQTIWEICTFADKKNILKDLQYYYPGNERCGFGSVSEEGSFLHTIWTMFIKEKQAMDLVKTMVAAGEYARHHYVRKN